MIYGLIFAEQEELDAVKSKMKIIKEHNIYGLTIYESDYDKSKCYLVRCGVGKVNAARVTQILISTYKPDYIINMGVAGSVDKKVSKCDVVIATSLVQHDFDVTIFGREKGYIPNTGKFFTCDDYLIEEATSIKIDEQVHQGIIASGDLFVSDKDIAAKINKKFNALCVEMEGAAIAQVCYLSKIPFLVIRSISDSPYEEDNHLTFNEFLKESSDVAAKLLIELIDKVNRKNA